MEDQCVISCQGKFLTEPKQIMYSWGFKNDFKLMEMCVFDRNIYIWEKIHMRKEYVDMIKYIYI